MTNFEMGQIMAYLMKHRRIETTGHKRKSRVDGRVLAAALRDASLDERTELEALLRGMGFDLTHFTAYNTQGIAPGGDVFMLPRRLDEVNELFSERWIDERMQQRNDTVTDRRIWFVQFWFVLFSLFYTQRDRVATEVARYVETTFLRTDLVGAMRDYINDLVRKLGPEAIQDDVVYKCLTSESGAQLERYCERFLALMTEGCMLEPLGDDRYRQSLLSAVELKNNYLQGLEPWLRTLHAGGTPLEAGRVLLVKVGDASTDSPEA